MENTIKYPNHEPREFDGLLGIMEKKRESVLNKDVWIMPSPIRSVGVNRNRALQSLKGRRTGKSLVTVVGSDPITGKEMTGFHSDPFIIYDEWADIYAKGIRRSAIIFGADFNDGRDQWHLEPPTETHKPRGKGYGYDDAIPQPKASEALKIKRQKQEDQVNDIIKNWRRSVLVDEDGNFLRAPLETSWRPRVPVEFYYDRSMKGYRHRWKPPEPIPEQYGQW